MAQVISSEVQCSTYIWARVVVDYSGTSATANIQYRHSGGGYTGYTGSFNYGAGGSSTSGSWNNETVSTSWTTKMSIGFSISQSGGTYNVWCSGYSYNAFSVDVSIPTQQSSPTGLSLSNITSTKDSFSATVSVSGWGIGGTTSSRLKELSVCTSASASQRKKVQVYENTLSTTITVDNTATLSDGAAFTITPNTSYYITMWASNGAVGTGNSSYTQAYTAPPDLDNVSVFDEAYYSANKEVIAFKVDYLADGGALDKQIQYRFKKDSGSFGNWMTFGTQITDGNAGSEYDNIILDCDSTYTIEFRVITTASSSESTSIQVTTFASIPPVYTFTKKDINPVTIAITGNDDLLIYNQSILQFKIENLESYHYTTISSMSLSFNGSTYTFPTPTYSTDAQGVTTQLTPTTITYGTVDFQGSKTGTLTIVDSDGVSHTEQFTVSTIAFPEIQNITYSFTEPFYLTTTMTVKSWYNVGDKALVRLRLYWLGDSGQNYDYTISDLTNSKIADSSIRWIEINPTIWTAQTTSQISDITQYMTFTATIDLRKISGKYTGSTPWIWLSDNSQTSTFDNFNFEWSLETQFGSSTKSQTNLSTPANYTVYSVEGVMLNGVLTQVIREKNIDFVRVKSGNNQVNKLIRRIHLVNSL